MDCSPSGSSVHGILQARTLEWVPIPFSRGSSRPRDQTQISCTAGRFLFFFFTIWALSKVLSIKTCVASVIWDLCPLRSLQNLTLLLIPGSQLGELAAHPQTTKGLFSNFLLQWTWFPFRKPSVIKNIWKGKKAVYSPWGGKDGGGLISSWTPTFLLLLLPKSKTGFPCPLPQK